MRQQLHPDPCGTIPAPVPAPEDHGDNQRQPLHHAHSTTGSVQINQPINQPTKQPAN